MKATTEHLEYLDDLRDSGITNMFGAAPYLMDDFPDLTKAEARSIITEWMETYASRHVRGM